MARNPVQFQKGILNSRTDTIEFVYFIESKSSCSSLKRTLKVHKIIAQKVIPQSIRRDTDRKIIRSYL